MSNSKTVPMFYADCMNYSGCQKCRLHNLFTKIYGNGIWGKLCNSIFFIVYNAQDINPEY